jgi:hypothetical protein
MMVPKQRARSAIAGVVVLIALALAGCTAGTSGMAANSKATQAPVPAKTAMKMKMDGAKVTDASYQECADCAGKGKAPMVDGKAVVVNGVQMVHVGVKNGYYTPNMVMVKADMPVMVMFSGKAKDCLAKPLFKTLGKKGDFSSGAGNIELGALKAGTYDFSCGMGVTGGKIVAQ